jgi:hypothetical protein
MTLVSVSLWSFAQGLQEYPQVGLIYLEDTRIEGAMSRSGIAPFFRVQESQAEFTDKMGQLKKIVLSHRRIPLTFSVRRRNRGRP